MEVTVEGTEITPEEFRTADWITKFGKHVKELRDIARGDRQGRQDGNARAESGAVLGEDRKKTNGYVRGTYYEPILRDIGLIANYWTCRVFMLRADMDFIGAMHLIYNDNYYGKVEITKEDGTNIVSRQNSKGVKREDVLVSNVKTGDIFSFGLRIVTHNTLVGVANDVEGPQSYQHGAVRGNSYRFKFWQNNHILLSWHISQEDQEDSERRWDPYLPPDFFVVPYSEQRFGSSMIAWLELADQLKNYQQSARICGLHQCSGDQLARPLRERERNKSALFKYNLRGTGLLDVVGAIDGCHVRISRPTESEQSYYNRKKFHSIIFQRVSDAGMMFTDVFIGIPGRAHDS
ncbi:hypothetical protein MRX96_037162 [Rhipicephalus microplus]